MGIRIRQGKEAKGSGGARMIRLSHTASQRGGDIQTEI